MPDFKHYLLEAIKFKTGKDDDFFFDNYAIVTFGKNDIDKYKVEGRTAGLWSHACKHLDEVDKQFVDNIVAQVKRTMIQYVEDDNHPRTYEVNYFNKDGNKISGSEKDLVNKASRASIINFLDMVNDKVQLEKQLAPIESKMVKFLKALGDRYAQIIEDKINKAVNIDSIESIEDKKKAIDDNAIITFYIRRRFIRSEVDTKIYLDLVNHILIVQTNGYVNTMYQYNNSGDSKMSMLKAFVNRFMRNASIIKPSTRSAILSYID